MENKYYTPAKEEFHIGFEYEIFEDFDTLPEKSWHKFRYGNDLTDNPESLSYPLGGKMENIRVKVLDDVDIWDLGWLKTAPHFSITGENGMGYILIKIESEFGENRFEIRPLHPSNKYGGFWGVINNKSELKKLMKQTGIIK